jgi:hypothetical protein
VRAAWKNARRLHGALRRFDLEKIEPDTSKPPRQLKPLQQ